MWNFDVRSDDAYKGGISENDGDVFHQLEISQGILTTNWNINDMWVRLYNCLGRVNAAINALKSLDMFKDIDLIEYHVDAITGGTDAFIDVIIKLQKEE